MFSQYDLDSDWEDLDLEERIEIILENRRRGFYIPKINDEPQETPLGASPIKEQATGTSTVSSDETPKRPRPS